MRVVLFELLNVGPDGSETVGESQAILLDDTDTTLPGLLGGLMLERLGGQQSGGKLTYRATVYDLSNPPQPPGG